MSPTSLIRWPAAAAAAAVLAACSGEPEMLELSGYTMGTSYSVRLVNRPGEAVRLDALPGQIAARLEELEASFSTYRATSEISRFNAREGEAWFEISPAFRDVLERGMAISALSGGAFDMTLGPLVDLWGFGTSGTTDTLPPQAEIDALLDSTGYDHIEVRSSPPAVRRTQPGVKLDLSAIAKGFAVDEIWALLGRAGLTGYMVEVGGEVRTRGTRADGSDWSIGIENPLSGAASPRSALAHGGLRDVVHLRDAAIATSGDYRNYFEHDGTRYSHTLDPRTGWPVSHGVASVSVIARSATDADALATALMVLGPERGLELATRENIAAQLILRAGDQLSVVETPAFEAYLAAR